MGVHLYTNGAWTDSGRIYRNSLNLLPFSDKTFSINIENYNLEVTCNNGNLYFSGTVGQISSSQAEWKNNFSFELEAGTYYCNSPSPLGSNFGRYIRNYSDDTTIIGATDYMFTLSETTTCYLAFYIFNRNFDSTQLGIMLNTGSTAIPYEPYNEVDWYTNTGHGYSSGAWS